MLRLKPAYDGVGKRRKRAVDRVIAMKNEQNTFVT